MYCSIFPWFECSFYKYYLEVFFRPLSCLRTSHKFHSFLSSNQCRRHFLFHLIPLFNSSHDLPYYLLAQHRKKTSYSSTYCFLSRIWFIAVTFAVDRELKLFVFWGIRCYFQGPIFVPSTHLPHLWAKYYPFGLSTIECSETQLWCLSRGIVLSSSLTNSLKRWDFSRMNLVASLCPKAKFG